MRPILVFDLDDTLYDELSYVYSGFNAVATFLAYNFKLDNVTVYELLKKRLVAGRGRIFDDVLSQLGLFSRKNVQCCISAYRLHNPSIALYPDADECLERFKGLPIYIVTDGNKLVQQKKLEALDLVGRVKRCFITHRFGIRNAKPSPYCFQKICASEKVCSAQVIYIADNPSKDFVGIKPLGFRTVRVLTGQHKMLQKPAAYEAEFRIHSLHELDWSLLNAIFQHSGGL